MGQWALNPFKCRIILSSHTDYVWTVYRTGHECYQPGQNKNNNIKCRDGDWRLEKGWK